MTTLILSSPQTKPKGFPPGLSRQRASPVPQGGCVDLQEASTIHEDFGTHVAHGNQLGPALEPGVVLLQDLGKRSGVSQSSGQAPPPSLLSGSWESFLVGTLSLQPAI